MTKEDVMRRNSLGQRPGADGRVVWLASISSSDQASIEDRISYTQGLRSTGTVGQPGDDRRPFEFMSASTEMTGGNPLLSNDFPSTWISVEWPSHGAFGRNLP